MENKDEQIRKELIYFIRKEKEYIESKVKPENSPKLMFLIDALAYLEKQKEQKPLMYDGEIEDTKRDIVAAIRKYYPADYAEYLTSFLKGLSPEDNSEDEYGQEMLGIAYKLMYEHIPENLRTQEFWNSLKFMREYTGKVAIIHSYEKPAEWSEEDKHCIHQLILFCENCMQQDSEAIRCATWLKSLRPSPHWKPSEEQIRALEDVKMRMSLEGYGLCPLLQSLIDDLKSL